MGRSKAAFDFLMTFWPLGKFQRWAGRQPVLGCIIHPDDSPERNQHVIIPINQVISGTESVFLPPRVLDELIERASARVVMNECMCRRSEGCQAYPVSTGCLFLGQAAAQIDPALCREVSVEEAKDYAHNVAGMGLTPMIVHSAFDANMLGIDFERMLTVCFCCDCCCTVRVNLRNGDSGFSKTVLRFPGLHVDASEECTLCEACLAVCPVNAIRLVDGKIVIDEGCKGCGNCASACPAEAIHITLDEENQAIRNLVALVDERTYIGHPK